MPSQGLQVQQRFCSEDSAIASFPRKRTGGVGWCKDETGSPDDDIGNAKEGIPQKYSFDSNLIQLFLDKITCLPPTTEAVLITKASEKIPRGWDGMRYNL